MAMVRARALSLLVCQVQAMMHVVQDPDGLV